MARTKKGKKVTHKTGTAAITAVTVTQQKSEKKTKAGFKVSDKPYDTAVPTDFNFENFKPLKKKNFVSDHLYFMHRANEMSFKRTAFLVKAEEAKKLGSSSEQRKKKQIVKLQSKMDELKQQLEAQGVDVKALLATASKDE